tara:strand:+ start:469 stop:720 length:252 start_codon:yes stop_codon:yes gene_type:complete
MSSLQVIELPENIFSLLRRSAKAKHRSIAQEAIAFLAKGLDTSISPKVRRVKLLQIIAKESGLSGGSVSELDPVELNREDRER